MVIAQRTGEPEVILLCLAAERFGDEQAAFIAEWEKTSDAKMFNWEKCPIDFRLAADGTFTVPDLPVGDYRVTVASWTGAPVTSRMTSRGTAQFTIVELPTGRSDQPFDAGEIVAYSTEPLRAGDSAPLFEANTFDGRRLKLAASMAKNGLSGHSGRHRAECVAQRPCLLLLCLCRQAAERKLSAK